MRMIKMIAAALMMSLSTTAGAVMADEAETVVRQATPLQMATRTYMREAYDEARDYSREACLHGEADGCALLADLYRRGLGGPQDHIKAAGFYEQSCEGGIGSSCATLAHMHHQGSGVEQSFTTARALYDQGCKADEISACAAYGNMVYAGLGGAKDTDEGQAVMRLACRADYDWACERLRQYGLRR